MRSWSRLATRSSDFSSRAAISSDAAARASGSPMKRSGSNRVSNKSTSSRAISTCALRHASRYSWLNVEPACRRYLAYARRTEACRQDRPACSTSALNPSLSASPRHTAANASWNSSLASAASTARRASYPRGERWACRPTVFFHPPLVRLAADGLVEVHAETVFVGQLLEAADVGDRRTRREVLLVRLGECLPVAAKQPGRGLLTHPFGERVGEVVAPGPGGHDEPLLQGGDVQVGQHLVRPHPDHEVQARQHRLAHQRRVVDGHAFGGVQEDDLYPLADVSVVPVPREVDEAGQIAAVDVAADEQPQLTALLEMHDRERRRQELLGRRLEQLVTRIRLEHLHEVLARVPGGGEPALFEHLLHPAPQDGNPYHALGVGRRGEQAEEPALADDLAGFVERLHPDVVEVG